MHYDWTGVEQRRRMVLRSSFAIFSVLVVTILTLLGLM
jgi:hypothetical protein